MDKSDSAHQVDSSISIQQGDWDAYRHHIETHGVHHHQHQHHQADVAYDAGDESHENPAARDSSGQPLTDEEEILSFRRQCARAYIGMNGRLGGRAYHPNEPVILTQDAVNELAELNRILREERAQKKKPG